MDGNYGKVILWGLSQGCAAGIFTLLGGWAEKYEAKMLGAFVGMSGWLPFEQQLREVLRCDGNTSPAGETYEEIKSEDDSDTDDETLDESDGDSKAYTVQIYILSRFWMTIRSCEKAHHMISSIPSKKTNRKLYW